MVKKLLIIEDDPKLRNAIKLSFDDEDYQFFDAASVSEGIKVIDEQTDIKVIILDLNFPGEKGVKFLEHIKDRSEKYRTIILTARDDLLAAETAAKYNVFSYQAKLAKLGIQSLKFAVERAFKDIEGEQLKKKMNAHLEIQKAINSNQSLKEILNLICYHLITLIDGYTCHIRVFDLKKGDFELIGSFGQLDKLNTVFETRRSTGEFYSGKVAETQKSEIIDDLQNDQPFIKFKEIVLAKKSVTESARTYLSQVKSAYIFPIFTAIFDKKVDAIVNISSIQEGYFSHPANISIVDEFIDQISLAVTKDWLNKYRAETHRGFKDISSMLSEVSNELKDEYELEPIYNIIYKRISKFINPEIVSIFLYDEKKKLLENIIEYDKDGNPSHVRENYKKGENLTGSAFETGESIRLLDATNDPRYDRIFDREPPQVDLNQYLCAPMKMGSENIGILRAINKKSEYYHPEKNRKLLERGFSEDDQAFLEIAAMHLALTIQNANIHQQAKQWIEKLTLLNEIMQQMNEIRSVDELLRLILDELPQLIDFNYGLISRVDLAKGEQYFVAYSGGKPEYNSLPLWKGITGMALKERTPIRIKDVSHKKWKDIYRRRWKNTRSELAVPIFIENAEVRIRKEIQYKSKLIGVINLESTIPENFSKSDEDILFLLARHATIMIERLEHEKKMSQLKQMELAIAGKQDWDEIIRIFTQAITETLGYGYVNISLVNPERNRIKTEYVRGIPDADIKDFKKMADHPLQSNDIQAHIYRDKQIEVPDSNDERFDIEVVKRFGHQDLLRVFIPMITNANDQVIGTVEAGYNNEFRKYIYESDIQILENFIDYAVQALERKKKGLLDQISHEFRAPLVGIKSNASFLRRRIDKLEPNLVQHKFNDIMTDCDLLLYQVQELEHILGRTPPNPKRKITFLFKDVVIKIVKQLKPMMGEAGLNIDNVKYELTDLFRLPPVYVDRPKINQVVYNLMINSIKYAKEERGDFKIRISAAQTKDNFILKFADWGIGIPEKLKEDVFKDGFRTPEARRMHVSGSGLGLTISRNIMREFEGDLKLTNFNNPTEFQIVLPSKLKEFTNDTIHRR